MFYNEILLRGERWLFYLTCGII